jgi:hypothetical protein
MPRRLFIVLLPFTAMHIETGNRRILKADETLFAEPPARSTGVVLFEQDGEEFQVEAATFIASTTLAKH